MYVGVASKIRLEIVWAEDISFPTTRTKNNKSLEASNRYITGVALE